MSSLLVKTAIRGYHVYRVVWEPRVRESFVVLHESGNNNDRHAMAVYRDDPGVIVGHLPHEILKTLQDMKGRSVVKSVGWYRLRNCGNSCASVFEGNLTKQSMTVRRFGVGPSTAITPISHVARAKYRKCTLFRDTKLKLLGFRLP